MIPFFFFICYVIVEGNSSGSKTILHYTTRQKLLLGKVMYVYIYIFIFILFAKMSKCD